jgi:hypothetical protein
MKKISTVQIFGNEIFKEQKLTIGLDLGDLWSCYCVRDEAGQVILEQKSNWCCLPQTLRQVWRRIDDVTPSRDCSSAGEAQLSFSLSC